MKSIKLNIQDRKISAAESRAQGLVPGILYGFGIENSNVMVDHESLRKAFNLLNANLQVELEDNGKSILALLRDVKLDHISGTIIHFDLFVPNPDSLMKFSVPVKFTGQSLAIKNLGGVLEVYKETLQIESVISALPEFIEVDLSPLVELGSIIKIKDLTAPEGVTFVESPTQSIVASKAPKRGGKKEDASVGVATSAEGDAPAEESAQE